MHERCLWPHAPTELCGAPKLLQHSRLCQKLGVAVEVVAGSLGKENKALLRDGIILTLIYYSDWCSFLTSWYQSEVHIPQTFTLKLCLWLVNFSASCVCLSVCYAGDFVIPASDWQGTRQPESGDDPTESSYLLGSHISWVVNQSFAWWTLCYVPCTQCQTSSELYWVTRHSTVCRHLSRLCWLINLLSLDC